MSHIPLTELSDLPPAGLDEKALKKQTLHYQRRIGELNEILRADRRFALLVVLQGMDGSGKDGAVKQVFRNCTHFNISVRAFKKPTPEELAHDFLWRVHREVPAKGEIRIFNRSHYEDVLIQRVHGWVSPEQVARRMVAIRAFEDLLTFDNQTVVLKFYLHISPASQERQLRERLEDPKKRWKHSDGDWEERRHWDAYMQAYTDILNHSGLPWEVVPVGKRWYRDYLVSKKICETLESLNLAYPSGE